MITIVVSLQTAAPIRIFSSSRQELKIHPDMYLGLLPADEIGKLPIFFQNKYLFNLAEICCEYPAFMAAQKRGITVCRKCYAAHSNTEQYPQRKHTFKKSGSVVLTTNRTIQRNGRVRKLFQFFLIFLSRDY